MRANASPAARASSSRRRVPIIVSPSSSATMIDRGLAADADRDDGDVARRVPHDAEERRVHVVVADRAEVEVLAHRAIEDAVRFERDERPTGARRDPRTPACRPAEVAALLHDEERDLERDHPRAGEHELEDLVARARVAERREDRRRCRRTASCGAYAANAPAPARRRREAAAARDERAERLRSGARRERASSACVGSRAASRRRRGSPCVSIA